MKPFTISEQEREEILRKHIEATGRQYLPESKHETEEIYSFKSDTSAPSTGYSDMDLKDFDEFDFDKAHVILETLLEKLTNNEY
jgi:hypothetical protein